MPEESDEFYLGDGLYARTSNYDIRLRAPRMDGDHEVYLDGPMLQSLIDWARKNGYVLT